MDNLVIKSKNFWEDKNVLLTGHTGFKGTWFLTWLLELGSNVCGYSLDIKNNTLFKHIDPDKNFQVYGSKYQSIIADLADKSTLKSCINNFKPNIIFHFAAQPLVRESYLDPINTWETNLMGSLNLLESLRYVDYECVVLIITTDKVYRNTNRIKPYSEDDILGGHDPYSASKACLEIAVDSWRLSFLGEKSHQNPYLSISTARAGNVIGGGDWSKDRIIPDIINSIIKNKTLKIRNPSATRPWQHVLEPLSGYLLLAEKLFVNKKKFSEAFNFGPDINSNKSVKELTQTIFDIWKSVPVVIEESNELHESQMLFLDTGKVKKDLKWIPKWNFKTTLEKTVNWYQNFYEGEDPLWLCKKDLKSYLE